MFRFMLLTALIGGALSQAKSTPQSFHQPLRFEPNQGQASAETQWIARGPGYQVAFSKNKITLLFREGESKAGSTLEMKLPGSYPWTHVTGLEPTGGVSNYLSGKNSQNALTNVPHYARVSVANVYDGVDLVFHSNRDKLEYDFVVHPGADPNQIRLAFEGQRGIKLDRLSGDLILTTASGFKIRHARPQVYQQSEGKRIEVTGEYKLLDHGEATLRLGTYDRQQPLVIDPTIIFTSFLDHADARALAVDSAGNSYITGAADRGLRVTNNSKYERPSCGSFFGFCAGAFADVFVSKFSPTGELLFSTYMSTGYGDGIAVDTTGVYVTGVSWDSADDSIEEGAGDDVLILKLTLTGDYVYKHVWGGDDSDFGNAIALDSKHNVWVAGQTNSKSLTGKDKAISKYDVLVMKFDPQGKLLNTQTLGGVGDDIAYGIAVDHADNPWLTGQTCSGDFPASPGFNNLTGRCGVFVLALKNQSPTAPVKFASVFGGSNNDDAGYGIAINANNEIYITGATSSPVFPVRDGAFQMYPTNGYKQAFVTILDNLGYYKYSTYLGSNGHTSGRGIALSASNEVYISGETTATVFPGNGPVNPPAGFLSKFSPDLSRLLYSRQIGYSSRAVVTAEVIPAVTPTRIYTAGTQYTNDISAYVDRLTDDYYLSRLRNFWITDQYINIESGVPTSSQIGPGWWSAEWDFAEQSPIQGDPVGTKVFLIRNRWKSDQYLNIASGQLQSTPISAELLSAHWTLEPIAGLPNVYRIRNVFLPSYCLNIESGALKASPVEPGWWSSWWTVERVF